MWGRGGWEDFLLSHEEAVVHFVSSIIHADLHLGSSHSSFFPIFLFFSVIILLKLGEGIGETFGLGFLAVFIFLGPLLILVMTIMTTLVGMYMEDTKYVIDANSPDAHDMIDMITFHARIILSSRSMSCADEQLLPFPPPPRGSKS